MDKNAYPRPIVNDPEKSLSFTIPGPPATKKNCPRILDIGACCPVCGRGRKSMLIPSERFVQYQNAAEEYLPHKGEKRAGPYNLKAVYYLPTRRNADLLCLLDATCDILAHYGVLAKQPWQSVISHDGSRVLYDQAHPRVEAELIEVSVPAERRLP